MIPPRLRLRRCAAPRGGGIRALRRLAGAHGAPSGKWHRAVPLPKARSCGRSAKQPFCDGSHKGTSFTPVKFTAEDTKTAFLCGCKHSAKAPFCDGTHKAL